MKKCPVAYQIYSARDDASRDLPSVLKALSAMGYDGVEFAGFYGHSAGEIKAMLEETGLKAVSSHVQPALIEEDMFGVISYHKAIGCEYIAVPYLDETSRPGAPGFAHKLRMIYRFGELCRGAGIQLLYHNHDFEFIQLSGIYGLDFLYQAIPEELLASELDTSWVKYAGIEPCGYIAKYAGRCPVVHLKDYVGVKGDRPPYALIGLEESAPADDQPFMFKPWGSGCQDTRAVAQAAIDAGAKWLVIEQDDSKERSPLEDARLSIETLIRDGVK